LKEYTCLYTGHIEEIWWQAEGNCKEEYFVDNGTYFIVNVNCKLHNEHNEHRWGARRITILVQNQLLDLK